jgi:hypothetical protein
MSEDDGPPATRIISGAPMAQEAAPEVLYVQGMSNPAGIGQYPTTYATVALVLGILGMTMCSICTAVPGLILANSSLATAQQYPGHPDEGMAKAAKVVNWIAIGLAIAGILLFVVLPLIIIGIGVSSGEF